MKFDDHLAAYLYENKSLNLEGIGTLTLDDKVQVPAVQEKEVYYPIEGLAFTYNLKSKTDENIIKFLVKRLGKIEPLIRSDVEFYLLYIKQLLNIGEPYTIEGVGTFSKNNRGVYEFTPGNFLPVKEELNLKRENAYHNYPQRSNTAGGRIFIIILIAVLALSALGGIGWGVFNFIKNQPASDEVTQHQGQVDTIVQVSDTNSLKGNIEDSNANWQKSLPAFVAPATPFTVTGDSINYKMIFEITKSKESVNSRMAQLNNSHSNLHYDSIPINDSVAYYRLFLMMKVSPADTARVKDSLQILFRNRIFMEKNHD